MLLAARVQAMIFFSEWFKHIQDDAWWKDFVKLRLYRVLFCGETSICAIIRRTILTLREIP